MLRIREDQMAHLGKRTQQRFITMMADYLRENFPLWVGPLPEEKLVAWLEHALGKCERYGVTTEPEAAQFILLFVVLGADSDERLDWVKETLASRALQPIGKVKKLIADARARGTPGLEHVVVYEGMEA